MDQVVRKTVAVADLPEKLRDGLDPARPVEIVQQAGTEPSASRRLRQMTEKLRFKRLASGEEAVTRVRRLRDGEPI